jgi:hypothetical protein
MVGLQQQVHTNISFREVIDWQTAGFVQEHDVLTVGDGFATENYTYVPWTFFDMGPVAYFSSVHNFSETSHKRPRIVKPLRQLDSLYATCYPSLDWGCSSLVNRRRLKGNENY